MSSFNTNIIQNLVTPWKGDTSLVNDLEDFAKHLGWYPSDIIEDRNESSITTGHLFVEHGLDNSAVISFVNNQHQYNGLPVYEKHNLLGISYNNLVDLHISVDYKNIFGSHNRLDIGNNLLFKGGIENETSLKSSTYLDIFQEKKFKTIYPSLDDALIRTISDWKRIISSELRNLVENERLSDLFNAIIFLRAVEDYEYSKVGKVSLRNALLFELSSIKQPTLTQVFGKFIEKYNITNIPHNLINLDNLKVFDSLNPVILYHLFQDFYVNKYAQYSYDFSIMSKHALSRIYEKYVSLLEVKEEQQLSFFSPIPDEQHNKNTGSYYTPQFIARFFVRFLESNIANIHEQNLNFLEPAVGSGIFVRTFLESQIENSKKRNIDNNIFNCITAVDLNQTACNAANLSLSLLHLVNYDKFPDEEIKLHVADSLDFFEGSNFDNTMDIVISNPPYVKYNSLNSSLRSKLKAFLGEYGFGRTDLYIAFLKIAIESLKEGGYACFVLPNTFLSTDSANVIRKEISKTCDVKCIVDLSDNKQRIFEDAGVYPILLIFQKAKTNSSAIIAKIQDKTGHALYSVLNKNLVENDNFSIYEVEQDLFQEDIWYLLPPTEHELKHQLVKNPRIEDFFDVRTGFASGDVNAFILNSKKIPNEEKSIYVPYLSDREMMPYVSQEMVENYFFYPYLNGQKITEKQLRQDFPKTYNHIRKFEMTLRERSEVKKGRLEWWMPNRPRSPKFMMIPKILTPHLVFTPKFNIDFNGEFSISRAPFLVPKQDYFETELFFYFTGILNSNICFWYLLSHAPKYQKGFAMLEPTYLKSLPVPDPFTNDRHKKLLVQKVISLVKDRIVSKTNDRIMIEKDIDKTVADLYGLSLSQKNYLDIL